MSISQVTQGALADPASDKHHAAARTARERAAAAQKERQIGQRPRRGAQDAMPSYEAFERAQQLESKEHAAGASRIAKSMSDTPGASAEGDPLEPLSAGSSMKATAIAATTGPVASTASDPKTSDTKTAQSPTLPQDNPAPTASNEAAATTASAQTAPSSATLPASSEVEPAPAKPAMTVGNLVDTQLTTSTQGGYAQHYGSFPVLVAGQLIELDLYTLGQRAAGTPDSVRRLFLSLNSRTLGPVQVTAELSENRLSVFVEGASKAAPEALNEHVHAVGELAARLGWRFESVERAADPSLEPPGSDGLDRLL